MGDGGGNYLRRRDAVVMMAEVIERERERERDWQHGGG